MFNGNKAAGSVPLATRLTQQFRDHYSVKRNLAKTGTRLALLGGRSEWRLSEHGAVDKHTGDTYNPTVSNS
jgi:hypothetical protein